jgi:GxxExxY protein
MGLALREIGLDAVQQAALTVRFRGIVLELKAMSQLNAGHGVQLVNYLKASQRRVGLLLNFGPHPQFRRRVYEQLMNPRSSASIRVQNHVR